MNVIFLGGFDYPVGMAGTKRIHNIIKGLRCFNDISLSVLVLRQSCGVKRPTGYHEGIYYTTILNFNKSFLSALLMPLIYFKSRKYLRSCFKKDQNNILYVYGPITFDNLLLLLFAKQIGFKIIFDIVEDFDFALSISNSLKHRLRIMFIQFVNRYLSKLANGLVLISSHLMKKYFNLNKPIHHLPISIDIDQYDITPCNFKNIVKLFYAGSFGQKDGIPILLDAFDKLALKNDNLMLILTGKGTDEFNNKFHNLRSKFSCGDRIVHKGFLSDKEYMLELNSADILCMPRINTSYANAGFPFKLGEYLATGKPVIASMVSDIPLILHDKKEAMLTIPGDSDSIVAAVNFLLSDPTQASIIGAKGREIAFKLFDYKSQGQHLYKFLQNI